MVKEWQRPFNLEKCKIMHIGHKNKNEKYELPVLGKEIESVQQEKDLGVIITNDFKSSNQCTEAVKKAQKLLCYIKRQFRTRKKRDNINSIQCIGETPLRVCRTILVTFLEKRYRKTGGSTGKSNETYTIN